MPCDGRGVMLHLQGDYGEIPAAGVLNRPILGLFFPSFSILRCQVHQGELRGCIPSLPGSLCCRGETAPVTGAKTVLNMEQTCVGQGKGVCSAHRVTNLRIFLLV